MAATLIPTISAQIVRAQEGILKKPTSLAETIKSRIPGLAKEIIPLRDIWGKPIAIGSFSNSIIERLISPIYVKEMDEDKSTQEMIRLGIGIAAPKIKIGDIKLDTKQYDFYVETAGRLAKLEIDKYTNSIDYDRDNDIEKEEEIKRLYSQARREASEMSGISDLQFEQKIKKEE